MLPQIVTVSIKRCKSNGQHLPLEPESGEFPLSLLYNSPP